MTLSEQINATIWNTLHGVRHSPLSSPSSIFLGRTPRITSSLCRPYPISGLAPLVRWVRPFLLRSGPNIDSFFPVCPSLFLFTWVFLATGASVHRRGRCIGVSSSQVYVWSLVSAVLVCLSVDVAGTLVLPNSFCVSCLVLLHAPPIFCPHLIVPPSGPAHCASQLLCLCCPPPPCLSCASLDVLPCGGSCDCAVFVLLRARRFSWYLRSSLCLCGLCCFPCCLPSFVVVPVFVLSASLAPRVVLCAPWSSLHPGVLVPPSGYLVAAVTALLPCFHAGSVVKLCYPSVIRFMATKATSPVWGFHPLHHVTGDVGELSLAILRYSSC